MQFMYLFIRGFPSSIDNHDAYVSKNNDIKINIQTVSKQVFQSARNMSVPTFQDYPEGMGLHKLHGNQRMGEGKTFPSPPRERAVG